LCACDHHYFSFHIWYIKKKKKTNKYPPQSWSRFYIKMVGTLGYYINHEIDKEKKKKNVFPTIFNHFHGTKFSSKLDKFPPFQSTKLTCIKILIIIKK